MSVLRPFGKGFRQGWREGAELPEWMQAMAFLAGGAIALAFVVPLLD